MESLKNVFYDKCSYLTSLTYCGSCTVNYIIDNQEENIEFNLFTKKLEYFDLYFLTFSFEGETIYVLVQKSENVIESFLNAKLNQFGDNQIREKISKYFNKCNIYAINRS